MNELLLFPVILAAVPALVVVYLAGHFIKNGRLVIVKRGCSSNSVAKKTAALQEVAYLPYRFSMVEVGRQ